MHHALRPAFLVTLTMLTPGALAQNCAGQWTVYGTITNQGVFETIPADSGYSLVVDIPANTPGVSDGQYINYDVAAAFFSAAGYAASDASARISVCGSSDTVFITMSGPDASLSYLDFTNSTSTADVTTVQIILMGAAGGIDPVLTNDLPTTLDPTLFSARVANLVVSGAAPPSGGVDIVSIVAPVLADLNGDGILDNGDIGTFISLFLAGC